MENRYSSAKGDFEYLGWYATKFFSLPEKNFIFIAFLLTYLPLRVVFGSRGKRVARKMFEKRIATKERHMSFPVNDAIYHMTLRDLSDFDVFHEICIRDFYDTRAYLRPGMIVVDVGANIGAFSIMAAARVGATGKVIAFEPESGNFSIMEKTFSENDINNVAANKSAVSDYTGSGKIYVSPGHEGHSLIKNDSALSEVTTPVTTIDDALAKLGITHVDILKIDVEGSELAALAGAKKTIAASNHLRLMIDVIHYPNEDREVSDYLQPLGFSTRRVEDFVLAIK